MSTGTGRKPDVPQSQAQMAWSDEEIMKLFWAEFSSWELELKNFAADGISAEKNGIFVVTGPGPCQIKMPSFDFLLLREEQWLCNKAKKKKTVAAEQTP